MRLLLMLFICISIFLAGMVFGGQEQANGEHSHNSSAVEVVEEIIVSDQVTSNETPTIQDPTQMNFTQKTASFLEGTVNGLYDFIVAFLYEIASIFFSIA